VASAGTPPSDDGPVRADMDADVVIIGCGSTGISTALYLAQEHGRQAVVLEANHASWGCSSRSGGQGQNASGRLTRTQWIARWGLEVARQLDREIRTGFENFRQLTRQVDCDAFDGGHLYVAHRPEKMVYLRNEARVRREAFGYDNRLLSAEELRRDYCDERDAAGALLEQESVGIHPLKFTFGLIAKASALGVEVHPASPVQGWETIGGVHRWLYRAGAQPDAAQQAPAYHSPLEYPNVFGRLRSPVWAPFRRMGQRILYKWYWLRDEKL
jgi:glycine/D-amino acid oxidase-like deaminating enzyme